MNLFENATRLNLRFDTGKGYVSIQDLWSLSLSKLRTMYAGLTKNQKAGDLPDIMKDDSKAKTQAEKLDEMRAKVIFRIYEIKKEEKELAANKAATEAKKAQILKLVEKKKMEEMENKSVEELMKELENLG